MHEEWLGKRRQKRNDEENEKEDGDLLEKPEEVSEGRSSKAAGEAVEPMQSSEVEKVDDKAGSEKCRYLPHPGDPTPREVHEHRVSGHVHYRSWCASCVKARGLTEQHRRRGHKPLISIFSFDYLFINEDGEVVDHEKILDEESGVDIYPP